MKKDNERYIDLSDIKDEDLDKTSSFTDLMTRSDRKRRDEERKEEKDKIHQEYIEDLISDNKKKKEKRNDKQKVDDLEEMIDERKKSTKDLSKDLEKVKQEIKNEKIKQASQEKEENLAKTQVLEFTRQMKFNLDEVKEENIKNKKKGISPLNIIGEVNLLCIGYYIYLLIFTSFQDEQTNYLIGGGIVVLLVLLFGISIVSNKKLSKIFNILNILAILGFIIFNAYTFLA